MVTITAPREYSVFEDICTLKPFIELLSREFKDVACEFCFKRDPNLRYCRKCFAVKYCGKKCQRKDWKKHELECHNLDDLPLEQGTYDQDITRLIGNTILMIKGKDWKSIKINVLGMDVSFDDIDASDMSFPAYQHIQYNGIKEDIRRYIGDEYMPNDEDFKQIIGKMFNSVKPVTLKEFNVRTCRVIFELAFFSNECISNCHIITRNDVNIISAVKDIKKSEKLSLSKMPLFGVFDIPGITSRCNCTDCSLPYGESVLSKITDEQKALEIIVMTQEFINMWELFGNSLKMPDAEFLLDDLLEKHEGVLGGTNALHLKLLAIKCFETDSGPSELWSYLVDLEKNIVKAFGEFHPHLYRVCNALAETFMSLGIIELGMLYREKAAVYEEMYS